jgi:hypothetical protein
MAMRLLNYIFITLSAATIWLIARGFVGASSAALAGAFVFAVGFTTYSSAVMPEIMFMFSAFVLALILARVWAPGRVGVACAMGGIAGALMMIKPHGVALLLSTAATMAVVPLVLRRGFHGIAGALLDISALVISAYAAVVIIGSAAQGVLVLSPVAFASGFYGGIVSRAASSLSFAELLDILRYLLANGSVLMLFFTPAVLMAPVVALVLLDERAIDVRENARLSSLFVLAVFGILSAFAVLSMVAIFTHSAGVVHQGEANRIQGRYWGFLIPLFVVMTFGLFEFLNHAREMRPRLARRFEAGAGIVWLGAIALFGILVLRGFRLFPWDFPDLFALYRFDPRWNHAAWLPHASSAAIVLLSACAIAFLFGIAGRRLFYAGILAGIVVVSNVRVAGWQLDLAPAVRPLVDAGQAVTRMVGRESEGLFVAAEYWGRGQYTAFQLPLRTHVAVKEQNATLSSADVPASATWVLTMGPYAVQFPYSKAIPLAALTLYLRETKP